MCGIFGSIGTEVAGDEILRSLKHRGPDSQSSLNHGRAFVAHTRLSIQDLSNSGSQPMVSSSGRYIIAFNGEIYNHLELRESFKLEVADSSSDTSTILAGLEKLGLEFLKALNGIFSIILIDTKLDELIAVRDPLGVKPLYRFTDENGGISYSSEMRSFKCLKSFSSELDYDCLEHYVEFLWAIDTSTPFVRVKRVLPGTLERIKLKSQIEVTTLDSFLSIPPRNDVSEMNEQELIDELEHLLLNAVRRQNISDVPLGYFVSGGLDSSLIVAMAKRLFPENSIHGFCVDGGLGESGKGFSSDVVFAKRLCAQLGIELEVIEGREVTIEDFKSTVKDMEEPQADLAPVYVRQIAERAKEKGITVLLGGAAGDDLFSGYRRHIVYSHFKERPLLMNIIVKLRLHRLLHGSNPNIRRLRKLLASFDKEAKTFIANLYSWKPYSLYGKRLFKMSNLSARSSFESYLTKNNYFFEKSLNSFLRLEQETFLVNHNLNYLDKSSMGCGVEARVPFLDFDVVAFARGLDDSYLYRNSELKYLLKKVAERYLPDDLVYRKKTGFGGDLSFVLRNSMEDYRNRILTSSARPLFKDKYLLELLSNKSEANYSQLALLSFTLWHEIFVQNK